MKLLLTILTFLLLKPLLGQNIIYGSLASSNGEPIAFATVYSLQSKDGVYTNEDGKFQYTLKNVEKDTLLISHIGFESFYLPISEENTAEIEVTLMEKIVTLDEVVVSPIKLLKNANKIVQQAIDSTLKSLDPNEHILKGFYRQLDIQDNKPRRLLEAAIIVQEPGGGQERKFGIEELRRSSDNRISNDDNQKNLERDTYKSRRISCWYNNNLKRVASQNLSKDGRNSCGWEEYGVLNQQFIKEHKFKLDTISSFNNDLIYVIKILPSSNSKAYLPPKHMFIPVGKIFIKAKDFSIIEIQYNYILNPKKRNSIDYQIYKDIHGSGLIFQINAIYNSTQGYSYLSYLKTKFYYPISRDERKAREKESDRVFDLIEREFLVNEVITSSDESYSSLMEGEWDEELYKKRPYNESFWKDYNIILETDEQKKFREQLEKNLPFNE